MDKPYLQLFQDREDQVESGAYMLWRRFHRLGLKRETLDIALSPGFPPSDDTGQGGIEELQSRIERLLKEPIFHGFTNDEIGLLHLGRLVSITEGGLDDARDDHYRALRDYFLGTDVVVDYYSAISENGDYSPDEIGWVATEHGHFKSTLARIDDVNALWGITAPMRYENTKERSVKPKRENPSEVSIPLPRGAKSYDEVLTLTRSTLEKIDDMLLSKM